MNAARTSAAGEGLTEPLLDFIESHYPHHEKHPRGCFFRCRIQDVFDLTIFAF